MTSKSNGSKPGANTGSRNSNNTAAPSLSSHELFSGLGSSQKVAINVNPRQAPPQKHQYINPISRYNEYIEVQGLTLYDIYRKPRCVIISDEGDEEDRRDVNVDDKVEKSTESHKNLSSNGTNSTSALTVQKKNMPRTLLNSEVRCPICLGILKKTYIVMECLHRFCGECIQKHLRLGKKECPSCRVHIPSRRSLRPDSDFDNFVLKVFGDVEALEEAEAKEIEAFNQKRNMHNAYSESRKLGIMQQAMHRKKSIKVAKSSSSTRSHSPTNTSPLQQRDTSSSSNNANNNSNSFSYNQPRNSKQNIRISNLTPSPLVDFILRKHPGESKVSRLQRECIRTSKEIQIGQLKRFLAQKLGFQPSSDFQIATQFEDKTVVLKDFIKLSDLIRALGDFTERRSLIVLQYRICREETST